VQRRLTPPSQTISSLVDLIEIWIGIMGVRVRVRVRVMSKGT
jgi:hypothetical protein